MNEELTNVSGTEMSDTDADYVAAIQELQNNSVSKEQYNKLRSENKKLLDALVNGQQIDLPKEEPVDIEALRSKLFNSETDLNNLEYVDTALKLRKALIDQGEPDPFVGCGSKIQITNDMYDSAERVAEGLQYCVDFADGDSGIFTAQLQRITKDVIPGSRKR